MPDSPGSERVRAEAAPLWDAVDGLLARTDTAGILAHELGPLAARRLRRLGEPVPPALADEERRATAARLTAIPLLGRIREIVDGPLLLLKGPEVACLYPGHARAFLDVDLLAPDGAAVHESLKSGGFVEVDDPELFRDHHHLRPLQAPGLWLRVEVHLRPMLPRGAAPARIEGILDAAVPSAVGIAGLSAPAPRHHALLVAAHAWVHEPFRTLRDLVDVAAVAAGATEAELAHEARAWGIERIWRTTEAATNALFFGGSRTIALRAFGRHLPEARERTVLDNHAQRWLHSFWELPFGRALLATGGVVRQELLPEPGESWRHKLARAQAAVLHPRRSMTAHTTTWRRDVESGGAEEGR